MTEITEDQTITQLVATKIESVISSLGGRKFILAVLGMVLVNIQMYNRAIDSVGYVTIMVACLGIFNYANVMQKKVTDPKATP